MKLQERELSIEMHGDDVALLQKELMQLGFEISDSELKESLFGETTQKAVIEFQQKNGLKETGVVDEATATAINQAVEAGRPRTFIVRGQIHQADGSPFTGGVVQAFDKDLRSEELLGKVTTTDGQYEITYIAENFSRAEKDSADLVVRLWSREGALLKESPIFFNAPPVATVNLVVGEPVREPSEYARHIAELMPLTEGQDVSLSDLKEDEEHQDISFLSGETRIHPQHIVFLAIAHRHALNTRVPPEAFYALFRQDLPTNLPALVLQRPERLRTAIERSVGEHIVPSWVGDQKDQIVEALLLHTSDIALKRDGAVRFHLGELLATAGLSLEAEEKFINLCRRDDLTGEAFWEAVDQDPDLARDGTAETLEFTVQVGILTRDNIPLVGALQDLRRQGSVRTARDLVRLTPSEWESMLVGARTDGAIPIPPVITGDTEAERLARYIDVIVEVMKQVFPTDFVTQGVARELIIDAPLMVELLARNPGFDLRDTPREDFNWGGLDEAAQARARASLEELRREVNIFPQFDAKTAVSSSGIDNPFRRDLARFLANAPDFDFGSTHIHTFLTQAGENVFTEVVDREALEVNLKRFQRVFQFAPRFEHIEALLGHGIHSAFDFAAIPLSNALKEFGPLMGDEMYVKSAHANASQKSSIVVNIAASVHQSIHDKVAATGGNGIQKTIQDMPSLATLFGSLDLCECEHCRSVYGPAAYFVDLLQFLRKSSNMPFTRLMARRPDLQYIKLTCENSNTPLPYLDLVNEILETYVALGTSGLNADTIRDTTPDVTAEELSINPQYTIDAAYEKLQQAVHGFYLPFNRPIELARAYLERLGSSRYEVMTTFQSYGTPVDLANPNGPVDPDSKDPSDVALAREYLKISPKEYDILIGASTEPVWWFFGYASEMFVDTFWNNDLEQVPSFLHRTGIVYDDLVELLRTRYVNPVQTPNADDLPAETIVLFSPNSVCDLEQTWIRRLGGILLGIGPEVWLRFHRFLRLWRKLGWTMQELDKTMHTLGALEISRPLIEDLARIQRLKMELGQSVVQLLSIWAPLDTFDPLFRGNTLYHALFQNRAVINDAAYIAFALNEDGTELADTTTSLDAHAPAVQAALRVSAEDLAILRQAAGLDSPQVFLSLANLSLLYRHAFLARALKLKVREYVALAKLMGIDLTAAATPAQTVRFVERVGSVRRSGFNAAQLSYLFRHLSEPPSTVAPAKEGILLLLRQLQKDLREVLDETALIPDPAGEILHSRLAMVVDHSLVGTATAIIDGSSTMLPAEQQTFIEQHFAPFFPNLAEAEAVLLAPLQDPVNGPTAEETLTRQAYVYPRLTAYVRDFLSRGLVKQTLGNALKLEGPTIQLLIETVLRSSYDVTRPAMADFLALIGDGLLAEYFVDIELSGAAMLTRIEPTVSAYFDKGSPDSQLVPPGNFSARWTGFLLAQYDEAYTFYARSKDGVRLWVGDLNAPIINEWNQQPAPLEHVSAPLALVAGQVYPIRVEYFASDAEATIQLSWSSLSTPKAVIPQSHLYSGTSFVPLEGLVETYEHVYKVALLIRIFGASPEEARFLFDHGADFGNLDPNTWPLDRDDPDAVDAAAPNLFEQWEWLCDFFALRNALPQREISLVDVLTAPSALEARAQLAAMTGWDPADVDFLAGPTGLGLPDHSFGTATGPARLLAAFALARRLGIAMTKLREWAHATPDAAQAREIVHAVKAKYDDQEWLAVAKPLNDTLREMQRTALVAYILASGESFNPPIRDADQLFEYFLIDVSMGACMATSRIKQAISTVQLFVQRCLLNLEPGVSPDLIDQHRWEWMRNYRVWEANRKVFLYPENWIEPDLRDDKSPFFRELETQLLQQEITVEAVEQAYRDYLHKLDEVARLDICAVCPYVDEGSNTGVPSVIHIFGRTHNDPPVYYYRRFIVSNAIWTSWERVPLDILSEHLIPVIYNRRLYLFWATFELKPDPSQDPSGPPLVPDTTEEEQAYEECQAAHDEWQKQYDTWNTLRVAWETLMAAQGKSEFYPVQAPEEPEPCVKPEPPGAPEAKTPVMQWEIKLSWSQYRRSGGSSKQAAEYQPGRWAPKQTAKMVLVSKAYELNGKKHPFPELRDHTFEAVASAGGDLFIRCWRRLEDVPDDVMADRVKRIGTFWMNGCNGEIKPLSLPVTPQSSLVERRTPDRSRIEFMRFDQLMFGGGSLTFYGPKPDVTEYPILDSTPTHYQLVHPPYDVDPEAGGFAMAIYPFAYQDSRRTYLAVPNLDETPFQLGVLQFKPVLQVEATDALASKFKYIEKGDPGPMEALGSAAAGSEVAAPFEAEVSGFELLLSGTAGARNALLPAGSGALAEPTMVTKSGQWQPGQAGKTTLPTAFEAARVAVKKLQTFLRFHTLYHPHVCEFVRALNQEGIPGLISLDVQRLTGDPSPWLTLFRQQYDPSADVHWGYPTADVDFEGGAYSAYNWELFFHIPLLIADRLSKNQRFQDAQDWFHLIFNPTSSSAEPSPMRFWNLLPFYENTHPETEQIVRLLMGLHSADKKTREAIKYQIEQWRDNPFNPHLIARLRITAYQKTVVIRYIDNLIAWGDQFFARDTIESINEATQLYVLAHHILGERPQRIPPRGNTEPKSYAQIQTQLDAFSNALVEFENEFPFSSTANAGLGDGTSTDGLGMAHAFYFCIPQNEELLRRWDTVEDRLLKIRSCMNIEGVVRQLPLFEPPIDPALLVKATAMGLDLSSVLNDVNAPLPPYRFQTLVRQALELCAEVKSLGSALLTALEKGDAEELATTRAAHESAVLEIMRDVRRGQIQEAEATASALQLTWDTTEARRKHYDDRLKASLIAPEKMQFQKLAEANAKQSDVTTWEISAQMASQIPDVTVGTSGTFSSPVLTAIFGGHNAVANAQAFARHLGGKATDLTFQATANSIVGGYVRRAEEWGLQKMVAEKELLQIAKQIYAAQIRAAVATKELESHERQIANASAVEEFLHSKYTNEELYRWMESQASALFFQAYKLAYDTAKRAERAYRFERGLTTSSFIQFGYWDSLRRGLLAGEKLYYDVKRMELAYLDQNKREYELTKHISLLLHDPLKLIELKETGRCEVELPEMVFDMDYPGHYMRRIKNVSLTIPCITGPYTSINCTLTLLGNKVRTDSSAQGGYIEQVDQDDSRFVSNFAAVQSITTSRAQNDSGLFELNFRDERYLPFEGAGVISRWRIEMPQACNAFDLDTISDVIIKLNYTARDGGDLLRKKAMAEVVNASPKTGMRLFSAKHEFSTEWHRFLHSPDPASQKLQLLLTQDRLPFQLKNKDIEVNSMYLFLKLKEGLAYNDSQPLVFDLKREDGTEYLGQEFKIVGAPVGNLPYVKPFDTAQEELGTWSVMVTENGTSMNENIDPPESISVFPETLEDIWILLEYSATS